MLKTIKGTALSVFLMLWSTWVLAQTAPSGAPSPGASSPSGTTTSQNPGGPPSGMTTNANPGGAGDGLNWIWIVLAAVVIAGIVIYLLGRRRSRT